MGWGKGGINEEGQKGRGSFPVGRRCEEVMGTCLEVVSAEQDHGPYLDLAA